VNTAETALNKLESNVTLETTFLGTDAQLILAKLKQAGIALLHLLASVILFAETGSLGGLKIAMMDLMTTMAAILDARVGQISDGFAQEEMLLMLQPVLPSVGTDI